MIENFSNDEIKDFNNLFKPRKIRGEIHGKDAYKFKYEQYVENAFKRTHVILGRPRGWLIMDSFNNPFFPLDIFTVDTMKFNTSRLQREFHKKYGGNVRDLFLPWHYTVEIVDENPFVVQTRPLMYKTPIPNYERHISVLIIGDSNRDIYSGKFYKQIAHNIINPYKVMPGVKMQNSKDDFTFKTGSNFNTTNLLKELF